MFFWSLANVDEDQCRLMWLISGGSKKAMINEVKNNHKNIRMSPDEVEDFLLAFVSKIGVENKEWLEAVLNECDIYAVKNIEVMAGFSSANFYIIGRHGDIENPLIREKFHESAAAMFPDEEFYFSEEDIEAGKEYAVRQERLLNPPQETRIMHGQVVRRIDIGRATVWSNNPAFPANQDYEVTENSDVREVTLEGEINDEETISMMEASKHLTLEITAEGMASRMLQASALSTIQMALATEEGREEEYFSGTRRDAYTEYMEKCTPMQTYSRILILEKEDFTHRARIAISDRIEGTKWLEDMFRSFQLTTYAIEKDGQGCLTIKEKKKAAKYKHRDLSNIVLPE